MCALFGFNDEFTAQSVQLPSDTVTAMDFDPGSISDGIFYDAAGQTLSFGSAPAGASLICTALEIDGTVTIINQTGEAWLQYVFNSEGLQACGPVFTSPHILCSAGLAAGTCVTFIYHASVAVSASDTVMTSTVHHDGLTEIAPTGIRSDSAVTCVVPPWSRHAALEKYVSALPLAVPPSPSLSAGINLINSDGSSVLARLFAINSDALQLAGANDASLSVPIPSELLSAFPELIEISTAAWFPLALYTLPLHTIFSFIAAASTPYWSRCGPISELLVKVIGAVTKFEVRLINANDTDAVNIDASVGSWLHVLLRASDKSQALPLPVPVAVLAPQVCKILRALTRTKCSLAMRELYTTVYDSAKRSFLYYLSTCIENDSVLGCCTSLLQLLASQSPIATTELLMRNDATV